MQPMPWLVCLYVCAYVYLDPSATSPARGDIEEIEIEINILAIQETVVLFRIQRLQKSTSWVSINPTSNLVDFIDKYKRVFHLDTFQSLYYLAW